MTNVGKMPDCQSGKAITIKYENSAVASAHSQCLRHRPSIVPVLGQRLARGIAAAWWRYLYLTGKVVIDTFRANGLANYFSRVR